jgi:hypothetical protein
MLINLFDTEMANPADQVNEELNKKFLSKDKFAEEIESLVLRTKMNYIDAIVEYCEQNSIEIESVSKLVSKPLKEKLKCNATELNFMRKTTRAKLPL